MNAKVAIEVRDLSAGYGSAEVLFGVGFALGEGEVLGVLGRNGMGKSTLVKALFGLATVTAGSVKLNGREVTRLPSYKVSAAGLGWVPEGRHVCRGLTVEENMLATERDGSNDGWTLGAVYTLFPRLAERRRNLGSQLSGGEQQMLAIGRALLTQPRVLVLDEATEGLAPLIRQEIWRTLATLKGRSQTAIVVDRDIGALAKLADRYIVIDRGRIAAEGPASELTTDRERIEQLISV